VNSVDDDGGRELPRRRRNSMGADQARIRGLGRQTRLIREARLLEKAIERQRDVPIFGVRAEARLLATVNARVSEMNA
jgi:hypothetical protein